MGPINQWRLIFRDFWRCDFPTGHWIIPIWGANGNQPMLKCMVISNWSWVVVHGNFWWNDGWWLNFDDLFPNKFSTYYSQKKRIVWKLKRSILWKGRSSSILKRHVWRFHVNFRGCRIRGPNGFQETKVDLKANIPATTRCPFTQTIGLVSRSSWNKFSP